DRILGEALVFVRRPWLVAQFSEELDNLELVEKTGWRVRIKKAPPDLSVLRQVYEILAESDLQRTRFYRDVGDKIFRAPLIETSEASLLALGGFAEVGRSCMLVTTSESKVLLDCGLNLFARDSLGALPRLDVAAISMDDIDAVILTHAHIDHS